VKFTSLFAKEERNDFVTKFFLFLVSPLLGFLYSLRTINRKSSFVIFYLFALVFGLCFTVSNLEATIDGVYYRITFEEIAHNPKDFFIQDLNDYLKFDGSGAKDFAFRGLSFIISRVTDNYHLLFLTIASIFAFFQLKSLRYLVTSKEFDVCFLTLGVAYVFCFNHIFNINGARFWTSAWIGIYAAFKIFYENKQTYFLLVAITPIIHISFTLFAILMVIAKFSMRFEKIWFIIFVLSFIFSSVSIVLIQENLSMLPPIFQNIAIAYTSEESLEQLNRQGSGFYWLAEFFNSLRFYFMHLLTFLLILKNKTIKENKNVHRIFMFLIVLDSFANFAYPVPSLGKRFILLTYPLIMFVWIKTMYHKYYDKVLLAIPFIFSWPLLYSIYEYYSQVLTFRDLFTSPLILLMIYI